MKILFERHKRYLLLLFPLFSILFLATSCLELKEQSTKEQSIDDFREYFSKYQYGKKKLNRLHPSTDSCILLLGNDGLFADQMSLLTKIEAEQWGQKQDYEKQDEIGLAYGESYNRYWKICENYRSQAYSDYKDDENFRLTARGIITIGKRELSRANVDTRFHASCFAIPSAAINSYFALLDLMDAVENKELTDPLFVELNQVLKQVGMQSWTQPIRNDDTDNNIISLERFRHHVWWVGGNGLSYRSVFPCAFMMKSIPMVEVLAEAASRSISQTSQITNETSFWAEGFTSDGAGWGHGRQCLIFGYPIDGTSAALSLLSELKNSPWQKELTKENIESLFNYLGGSSFYNYRGYDQLFLARSTFAYKSKPEPIKSLSLVNTLLENWTSSFTKAQIAELQFYKKEAMGLHINMDSYPKNTYTGIRYFYNNDDLIKKNPNYTIYINMASVRVDGTESFKEHADKLNLFSNDGATFFTKEGREYLNILGAWNVYAVPGVTNRHPKEQPKSITNWRGFCSKHNFAGAAISELGNGIAGFYYEKLNASVKKNVNDRIGLNDPNLDLIYGVKAHKCYFILDDYMLALGAGITNLQAQKDGDVKTTINQTHLNGPVNYLLANKKYEINSAGNNSIIIDPKSNQGLTIIEEPGNLSYAFIPEWCSAEIELSCEQRETDWGRYNMTNETVGNLPDSTGVFQLVYNHGHAPMDDTYGYIVYTGKDNAEQAFNVCPVIVLSNDTLIQAVQSADKSVLAAVFYSSDKILDKEGVKLKVSHPAIVLLEKRKDNYILTLNDPTMTEGLEEITVSTNFPLEKTKKRKQWYTVKISLPQGKDTGRPLTVEL